MKSRHLSASAVADMIVDDSSESNKEEEAEEIVPEIVLNTSANQDDDMDNMYYPNPGVDVYFEDSDDAEVFMCNDSYSSSDGEDGSSNDSGSSNANSDFYCLAPSGIKWNYSAPVNRRLRRDMIDFHEGAKTNPSDEVSSFHLFCTEIMLRSILRLTNRRMRAKKQRIFTFDELTAGIGIIIRSGADKNNLSALNDLYDSTDSAPFYRCALAKNRMKQLLENLTLDEKRTRTTRQEKDKMAAVREIWDIFVTNLQKYYIPSENLTVDEQLYGYRGYVPARAYMPSKPTKYGIKIFWLNDSKNGFALNAFIYSGKGETREVGLAEKIVLHLTTPYHGSNRNIFMDRYFTSHNLVVNLLRHDLTATGTIPANRRDVPHEIRNVKGRDVNDTKALYDLENRVMLMSYTPRKNKNVLLMSSSHQKLEISSRADKKPLMILDYNANKGGTDLMDSRIEDYSCKRKTRRYPVVFFFNILDVTLLNSFLIMELNGYTKSRKIFIKKVAEQLAEANIQVRYQNAKIYAQSKSAFHLFGLRPSLTSNDVNTLPTGPRKCQVSSCCKSTRHRCSSCTKPVCSNHKITNVTCHECKFSEIC